MKDFRTLSVWKKAHEMTLAIYAETAKFPKEELFALTSQLRRATASIPTNIAEGCGRGTDADFRRFLQIGFGSASEVEYLLLLSSELKYIDNNNYKVLNERLEEIKKMLTGLITKLR